MLTARLDLFWAYLQVDNSICTSDKLVRGQHVFCCFSFLFSFIILATN